jgi:hypothetical protein
MTAWLILPIEPGWRFRSGSISILERRLETMEQIKITGAILKDKQGDHSVVLVCTEGPLTPRGNYLESKIAMWVGIFDNRMSASRLPISS